MFQNKKEVFFNINWLKLLKKAKSVSVTFIRKIQIKIKTCGQDTYPYLLKNDAPFLHIGKGSDTFCVLSSNQLLGFL